MYQVFQQEVEMSLGNESTEMLSVEIAHNLLFKSQQCLIHDALSKHILRAHLFELWNWSL